MLSNDPSPAQNYFVDFHCHATLRAMYTKPASGMNNMWEKTVNPVIDTPVGRWARLKSMDVSKESQTNFYNYANSGTRVIFDSIYPVEKGWLKFRKLPVYLVGDKAQDEMIQVAFGIDYNMLSKLRNNVSYFDELKENYQFLVNNQGTSPDGKFRYKLVRNYNELTQTLRSEPDCLAVVINIEGAHALECGAPCTRKLSVQQHAQMVLNNINQIKQWEFPVFNINLAHHFDNQLCGHARSFKGPASMMFNQKRGLNKGITNLGWQVIESLLSTSNGKRILIDTKHMSLTSRQEYYKYLTEINSKNPENKIPIICSHGGVNGLSTIKESLKKKDSMKKLGKGYYNSWSINLTEEEINLIHQSEGIIGLMMDKSVLGSNKTLRKIKQLSELNEKKDAFICLFLDNLFSIINAIGDKTAWNTVSLGTDYDGLIAHLDMYQDAGTIKTFYADLLDYLMKKEYQKNLWYGYTPHEMLDKLFRVNSMKFLERQFV